MDDSQNTRPPGKPATGSGEDHPGHFADYQLSVYLQGIAGVKPDLPVAVGELEARAREAMDPEAYGYVAGGAGGEDTVRANLEAFRRWRIVPRMLTDVARREYRTELLGTPMPAPVLLAPVGVLGIVHPEGELAVARAAASVGLPVVLSTLSSYALEEVAEAAGEGPRWFQLYWPRDPELTRSLLRRAEAAGYTALVVTLDTRLLAWRERDLQEAYLPFLKGQGLANYFSDPAFRDGLQKPPEENPQAAVRRWAEIFSDPSQTWDDLAFLRDNTSLPLVLKGILHPEDARRAVEAGADGIVVSNHGGRQVDGARAALAALPAVAEAVADRTAVLFDSGIRRGADVVKALALGARAVLLGRPYVWGLAAAGEEGVRTVLLRLLADFDLSMALSGCAGLDDLSPDLLEEDLQDAPGDRGPR